MAGELFKIDTIVADGVALAFEDGSASLEGAVGWEATAVLAGSGDDAVSRKRVPRMLKAKLLFKEAVDPAAFGQQKDIQISMRDSQSGRRAVAPHCAFASLGAVGAGSSVDVSYVLLSPLQWL